MFTFYKAVLRTGGKTPEDIQDSNEGWNFTEQDVQNYLAFYNVLDGMEVIMMKNPLGGGYSIVANQEQDNERIKEATYLAEQDPLMGTYIGRREEFDRDWDAGEYEPDGGSWIFTEDEVKILGEMERNTDK